MKILKLLAVYALAFLVDSCTIAEIENKEQLYEGSNQSECEFEGEFATIH